MHLLGCLRPTPGPRHTAPPQGLLSGSLGGWGSRQTLKPPCQHLCPGKESKERPTPWPSTLVLLDSAGCARLPEAQGISCPPWRLRHFPLPVSPRQPQAFPRTLSALSSPRTRQGEESFQQLARPSPLFGCKPPSVPTPSQARRGRTLSCSPSVRRTPPPVCPGWSLC